jgi:hypothetical protein
MQILIFLISIYPQTLNVHKKDYVLQETLYLENIVQFVELFFYIVVFFLFYNKLNKIDIAKYRYYDWIITTPIMLLTTIIYFEYNNNLKNNNNNNNTFEKLYQKENSNNYLTLKKFVTTNKREIFTIFILNLFMLFFGYLNEIGKISIYSSTFFGFLFFGLMFYYIYKNYVIQNKDNNMIFNFMLIVWSLYGVSAIFKNTFKNSMYNILDIISKNFYALYISYLVYLLRI